MEPIESDRNSGAPGQAVVWLSGEIVTFVNKIGPVIWLAAVIGVLLGVFFNTGRLFVAAGFGPLFGFFILATIFIVWVGLRVQRVGYAGRDLIVSNYFRRESISFDQVEAVEPVWWYFRRMVRIRLRSRSSFGQVLYYLPKWAAFKGLWVAPEKELQELIGFSSLGAGSDFT